MNSILIIGAGPAGIYSAETLSDAGHDVSIINRDIIPGGLAEFGIYPSKLKMKGSFRNVFSNILERDNVHYYGNITVGERAPISWNDLQSLGFDAILVAVGAQGTKSLNLPGQDAPGVIHAKDLVYHYNGLPPFATRHFPIGNHACVVGIGNVALDIVHWLVSEKQIDTVTTVARRGPAEVKFTKKEIRTVAGAMDAESVRHEIRSAASIMASVGQNPTDAENEILRFADVPLESPSPTAFRMKFLRSPNAILTNDLGNVTGLRCSITRLIKKEGSSRIGVESTGDNEIIPCDTVIFAIGDQIDPHIGLPLNPNWNGEYATVPSPWDQFPDRPRYMVFDPDAQQPLWGVFVAGWARNASDGLVGKARQDAVSGCDEILAYLQQRLPQQPPIPHHDHNPLDSLISLIQSKSIPYTSWNDVKTIRNEESRRAAEAGTPLFRIGSNEEMLQICHPS